MELYERVVSLAVNRKVPEGFLIIVSSTIAFFSPFAQSSSIWLPCVHLLPLSSSLSSCAFASVPCFLLSKQNRLIILAWFGAGPEWRECFLHRVPSHSNIDADYGADDAAAGPHSIIEAPRAGRDRGYGAPRSNRYLLVRGLHRIFS